MQQYEQENLLGNFEDSIIRASTGKRLANYIIDFCLFYTLVIIVGILVVIYSPTAFNTLENSAGFGIAERLLTLLFYAIYMGFVEMLFKGKSLGKLITGTRAVNIDGSRISANTAFLRGFSRAVPFCAFSAFGTPCNPWQDKWTNSLVMDEKQSASYS